jgi:hypothetical protein
METLPELAGEDAVTTASKVILELPEVPRGRIHGATDQKENYE